jgi:60 kDa SS-A/Ro ribonucleoprotein
MSIYAHHYSTRQTPQSEPIPGKLMVPNSAGGFTFAVDNWTRLERFLILGSAGGTYYATERALTIENAECVRACIAEDGVRTVRTIVEISDAGRAPKNDPAIFALALATGLGDTVTRAAAMEALPKVCRIGTHLFQFAEAVDKFRGWGRGLRKGIAAWYTSRTADDLAYQTAKYQQRNGWSHRDVLRLVHPVDPDPARQAVYRWAVGGFSSLGSRAVRRSKDEAVPASQYGGVAASLPRLIQAMEEAKTADRPTLLRLIREDRLPRECIPTEALNDPDVWDALLPSMPLTALVRNLGKMSAVGLLKPLSAASKTVCERLADQEYIRKSRLHPLAVLMAARTYASGHGVKGSLSWQPVSQVNDALDGAFYLAFGNVVPAGKRTLIALDVSGSMGAALSGAPNLSCREAAAALAMVTVKTEPAYQVVGFTSADGGCGGMWGGGQSALTSIDFGKCSRLTDAFRITRSLPFGGTDCALPMVAALERKWDVDTFIVITDNETWAGSIHPSQALVQYRQQTGISAKLAVVGMTSTGFTIADPSDAGMLDVVGFDAAAPQVMNDFSRQ